MRNRILLLACLTLIFYIPSQSFQRDETAEEYKVYSAILKAEHQADKPKTIVIIKRTSENRPILPGSDDQKDILKALSPLTQETLMSYNSRNAAQTELGVNKFDFIAKVALLNADEISEIFHREGLRDSWKAFYQKFSDSGGVIKLSRVGFAFDTSQALIFVSHYCGALCASGTYYLLIKENGEWKVKREQLIWLS